jgi:hypothetical protein
MPQNPLVKGSNEETQYTAETLQEFAKCAQDPIYCITNYFKVQYPGKGLVPFEPYPYQVELIKAFQDNRWNIVLSSRQTGKSVTACAFLLWYAMFNFQATIIIASNVHKGSLEMIHRIRTMYENLPMWLKPGITPDGWNKLSVIFDNKSRILSSATSKEAGRGYSIDLLYLDEFAFVLPNIQHDFWTAILPTLSTGGRCLITSTPNGDADLFAELWRGAEMESNGFWHRHVKWDEPPGRDEEFKKTMIDKIGLHRWKQEFECEFISDATLLIDSLVLQRLTKEVDTIQPIFSIQNIYFWEKIEREGTYIVGVDPATGIGKDYTVFQVFSVPDMRQVAEYRSNVMSISDQYSLFKNLLLYIEGQCRTVYFSIESNGVGAAMLTLYEQDTSPPKSSSLISDDGRNKLGYTTTHKVKMRAAVNFKEMLEKGSMTIRSPVLLTELKNYARRANSYEALPGATDDAVSAVLICVRLFEEVSKYDINMFNKMYALEEKRWSVSDFEHYRNNAAYDGYDDIDETDKPLPMM